MSQRFYADPGNFGVGYPVIAANSITFSTADPVYINTSGFLDLCSNSVKVLGYSLEDAGLQTSDNQTVAMNCPKYVYQEGVLVVYPLAAAAAATQTMIGEYTVVSGTTSGAYTLSASTSATAGQFFITGLNPNNAGSLTAGSTTELSEVVVKASFKQLDTYAAS